MKLNLALLGSLATLVSCSNAQYFSQGWKPGQPAHTKDAAAATSTGWTPGQKPHQQQQPQAGAGAPAATPEAVSAAAPFDWDWGKLLISSLNKLGMNLTAPAEGDFGRWDSRIPLITDDNYEDLIVNEKFESDEEAAERTWVICITSAASNKAEAVSKFVDAMFDSAYNTSITLNDLPNVRWGRIDYFNVTYITTKWNVWQAPFLVVLKDRGQTLRFYRPTQIRIRDDLLREFLLEQGYTRTPPWTGLWAPGGEREWLLDYFARYMTIAYNLFMKIPKIVLYVASGGLGSMILSYMHKPSKEQLKKEEEERKRKEAEQRRLEAKTAASKEVEKAKAPESPKPEQKQQQQSPTKGKGKRKGSSSLVDSSTEGSVTSPAKTRSSTRQRKGKKATQ